MRRGGILLWGVLLACAGLSAGCAGFGRPPSMPDDPLLASKKPIRGRAETASPTLLASAEQILPPEPTPTLLASSPALRQEVGAARELNAVPVNMPRRPPPAPANDPRRTVELPTFPNRTMSFAPVP